jgi:hypothetical protein
MEVDQQYTTSSGPKKRKRVTTTTSEMQMHSVGGAFLPHTPTTKVARRSAAIRANDAMKHIHEKWDSYDVEYVTTGVECKYMGEDPSCDPRTGTGLDHLLRGADLRVIHGHQGVGKTQAYLRMILAVHRESVNGKNKVVLVVPNTNLARSLACELRVAANDPRIRIRFYKDYVPQGQQDEWDILVVHAMSLVHYQVPGTLGHFFVDEISVMTKQLTGWTMGGADTNQRLTKATDLLIDWAAAARRVTLCGAQADVYEVGRMIELLCLDVSKGGLTWFRHHSPGPVSTIVPLESKNQAYNQLWNLYTSGHRVAVYCRYAKDATYLEDFLQRTAQTQNVRSPKTELWTSESLALRKNMKPHPADNPTAYLTAAQVDIMLYTTALPPGASITGDLFTALMLIVPDEGDGPGEKLAAQMAGRIREIPERIVYMYTRRNNTRNRNRTAEEVAKAAMQALVKCGGADVVSYVDENGVARTELKDTMRNNLKLEERIRSDKGITLEGIICHMSNAVLSTTHGEVTASKEPSPVAIEMAQEGKEALNDVIYHATYDEVPYVRHRMSKQGADKKMDKAERVLYITKMMPPHFVSVEWRLPYSLTNRALNLLDKHYQQLVVVHHMFGAGTSTPETTEEFERRYDAKGDTQEWMLVTTTINHLLTLASLGPIGPNLKCQALTKLPAADAERSYTWVSNNWKGCNSLLSKRSAAMLALPGIGDQKAWIKYGANVIKKQMGVGFRAIRGSIHLTYKVLAGALFQRLGIDMQSYVAWLRTEGPNNHTTSPTLWASCEQCTQLGVYAPVSFRMDLQDV